MMKIDEFVGVVQEYDGLDAEKEENGSIDVFSNDDVIIVIPSKSKTWFDIQYAVDSFDEYLFPSDKRFLAEEINALLETPIKDRFPEKKYRLMAMRYVEGPVAIKQYVTSLEASGDYVTFDFGSKENAEKWTDKELRNMSQWFPQKAIDAMKELVEGD